MNPDGEPESTVDVGRVARHHMHQVGAVGYREFPRRGTGRFLQVVDGVVALVRGVAGLQVRRPFHPQDWNDAVATVLAEITRKKRPKRRHRTSPRCEDSILPTGDSAVFAGQVTSDRGETGEVGGAVVTHVRG